MKIITLTYNYDFDKLKNVGRFWADSIYKNKDFIFEYSAASYATFIDKNPDLVLNLYSDDIYLIQEKLSKYNININNIIFHDYSEIIKSYGGKNNYSFDVLNDFIYNERNKDGYTLKIDCDTIFHERLPNISHDCNDVYVWKYERQLMNGNPKMGEIKSSTLSIGFFDYPIYNIGILGLPKSFPFNDLNDVYNSMKNVDIYDVSDLKVHSWHCAEQTAKNWIFHKYNYNIIQTNKYVSHHYDVKEKCINDAKYLLK